jgi:tetratricopeptide (TPR) repeat protein
VRKRFPFLFAIVLVVVVSCLALGLFAAYTVSQPVVSCTAAPEKPVSIITATQISAQDYFEQGDSDYYQNNCDEAIADYTRAIELNPNLAEAYNNRAYVYMVKREYAAALPDLDRAIQLRPTYVNALMNRGDMYNYYYSINYERAIAEYDQVLKIDPGAMKHTSVCGHRLLAVNHGWNLNVLGELLTSWPPAGCPHSN